MQSKKISLTFASRSRSSSPTVTRSPLLQVMSGPKNPTHQPDSHNPDNHKPSNRKPSNRKLGERLARYLTPPSSLDQLPLGQLPLGQLPLGQLPLDKPPLGQPPIADLGDCSSCGPMRRTAILNDDEYERDNPNVRHRWRGVVGPIIRLVDPTTPNHDRCDRASWARR